MPVTYSESGAGSVEVILLHELVGLHFPDLKEAGVTFTVLTASSEDGAPVKWKGVPATAVIKVNNLKDRTEGKADLTVTIDEEKWGGMTPQERKALLHHELLHPQLLLDEAGRVKRDNVDRPRMKLRPDDFVLSGFHEVVEKYGKDAGERQGVAAVVRKWEEDGLWEK